jgi:predicted phosphodiesterase
MTPNSPDNNGAPARIAVLSDVHGNVHAFQAVLDDVDAAGVDAVWFLGDLVGYGANPDECAALARERFDLCLAGNHDLGVVERIDIEDFSPAAATAALWTRENASDETLAFLLALEPQIAAGEVGLYHASPRDPVWEYVLSTGQAADCMDVMPERVAAIGHSHVALRFTRNEGEVTGEQVPGDTDLDLTDGDWLLNPGSVGQPRDGDPRAAWMLLDVENWTAGWRRVAYPIAEAAAAIEAAGLPRHLAARLHLGQ